jgi:hypothetical protein
MKHADISLISSIVALTLGCAAAPGTQPHDASAAQHEAMAAREDRAAGAHAEQHDPKASTPGEQCAGWGGCWTSSRNPTAQHAEDAKQHHELAQKHRAAAAALAGAEASSCAGLSDADRDISPFYHRDDIVSVSKLMGKVPAGWEPGQMEIGSTIAFRAVRGMTREWLQRVVDCHMARAAAVGYDMPEMGYCPLALKGVKATTTSTSNGFAVNVSSDDAATVAEIEKRANALK